VGLRPEDLRVTAWDGRGAPVQVADVEPLGGYTVVSLTSGGAALRALMRGQPQVRVGAQVSLACDPNRLTYFDAAGAAMGG
jgi:multiple sugar transport system ATP-binding protein